MSFQAVESKTATVGATALQLSSTLFNFATTNLTGAQKVTIFATSASLRVDWSGSTTTPTTVAGIPVTSGVAYEVQGVVNVANLKMIAATTSASVFAIIEK
jgi:hypothetical protein